MRSRASKRVKTSTAPVVDLTDNSDNESKLVKKDSLEEFFEEPTQPKIAKANNPDIIKSSSSEATLVDDPPQSSKKAKLARYVNFHF